jgi:nitrogenase molybdenum-iron protein alpha chain
MKAAPGSDGRLPMSKLATNTKVSIREQRLHTITGYAGTAAELVRQSQSGALRGQEREFTQSGTCASFAATLQLSLISDAAVVNHAPAGCAGDFGMFNLYHRYGQTKRHQSLSNARLISTNLSETDAVFGATAKLIEAVHEAYRRFRPRAIFVTSSCVAGIVGEDLDGAVREVEREIGIPVIAVGCEGFCSQVWATGWDAAFDAIVRRIVKPPRVRRPECVNVINFIGDDYFSELLQPLGLVPNLVVPFTTIEQLERLSEAAATVQMCPTLGTYLGAELERRYGVTEIKSPPPYGLAATDAWLREIGRLIGVQAQAERLIATEREAIAPELEALRRQFSGARAFVAAGPAHGHSFMCILKDLGMELVSACGWHHDAHVDHGDAAFDTLQHFVKNHGDVPYAVCHRQPYEFVDLIRRIAPDVLVIRHPTLAIWGAKLGIPTFFVDDEHLALGYRGLLRYGRKIADWYQNPALERNLSRHTRLPYSSSWHAQQARNSTGGRA